MIANNLAKMFLDRALKDPERTALKVKVNGDYQDITYHAFGTAVSEFSLGLRKMGVKAGDRVCILSENRPEWAYADLAILGLGAVTVPVYATSAQQEITYVIKHSEARVLVCSDEEQYLKVMSLRDECSSLQTIIVIETVETLSSGDCSFESVREQGRAALAQDAGAFKDATQKVSSDDLATLIYTSGTTGEPKGVMLSHGNFLSNIEACSKALPLEEGGTSLSFLPLSHVFERMAGYYYMLYRGMAIAYAESMETISENLGEVKPTFVASVPRLFEKINARILDQVNQAGGLKKAIFNWSLAVGSQSSEFRQRDKPMPFILKLKYGLARALVFKKIKQKLGGRLKFFISGGAPLPKAIAEFFFAADILILEGYGLTETSPVIAVNRPNRFRFGTVGLPIEGIEVKIAADGEILSKGPHIMRGYFNNDAATREAIQDGWFHTGDIGEFDEDGFLRITDRKKDIIVTSGGKNIAPQKIENLLKASEHISQVCVLGDKRNYLTALIVPEYERLNAYSKEHSLGCENKQDLINNKEIYALIRKEIDKHSSELARYETIKDFALLEDELSQANGELTPTLKVKRNVVTSKYADTIEKLYVSREPYGP